MNENEKKPFTGYNHGIGKIDLSHLGKAPIQLRPIEIHLKEDGAIDDKPSFVIVLSVSMLNVYGQISLKMLNEGLADIGYEIVKR